MSKYAIYMDNECITTKKPFIWVQPLMIYSFEYQAIRLFEINIFSKIRKYTIVQESAIYSACNIPSKYMYI